MIKTCTLTIFLAFAWSIGRAQPASPFSQFRLEHWNTKNGLPNDLILTMNQSKDGFLWLASFSGITRFDGVNFTTFNSRTVPLMKTDIVENEITESEDSTLWIPTPNSGLLAYKNGQFTSYLKEYNSLHLLVASHNRNLVFITNRGSNSYILFDTWSKKHTKLNDSSLNVLFKEGKISLPHSQDISGNLWRRINNKMVRIQNGEVHELTSKEGLVPGIDFQKIYVDKESRVWLTSSNGLFLWNGKAMIPYPGMEDKSFVQNAYSPLILEDRRGGIWAAASSGLAYLPANAKRFVFIPANHPLYSQTITNLLEDKEGNIWLSSTGLYKLSYSKFINYSQQDGLYNNKVSAVCEVDTNRYLVASLGKLFWIEHGLVRPYASKNQEIINNLIEVFHLYESSNKIIWVCADSKLIRISGQAETLITADNRVSFAFEEDDKKMWFGIAFLGIAFLDEKDKLEFLPFPKIDFKSLFISSIRKLSNGNWLVTSFNKGVLLIDSVGEPTYFNNIPGLPSIGVFSSYEDPDGTVWLTTQSGISRYREGKFTSIGFSDGLPENVLFDFLPDRKGYVWFPSNRGLIRAKKQELVDYLDKKINKIIWKLYDDADGMLNRQCVGARHGLVTSRGKLLVPSFGGLVEIDPDQLITNPNPPPVVVHRILRDNKPIYPNQDTIFKPGNHRYIFEYSALSLVAPEKVQIKFRLIGYDKDWITSVGDRKAYYTNIPSGEYTFQVIASNNDGVWNETGASFKFTIQPFFYETGWFRLLTALALLFFIFIVVRWRTQAVRKQNELLEAQVASRTEDLNRVNIELNQSNAEIALQRDSIEKTLIELKSTQSQLIQSEKMASLGELTAGIAHEIQNPLNFVNNFSEINKELLQEIKNEIDKGNLEDVKVLANDVIDNEEKINHHGKRADAIVKGMLEHSRKSSGQKELMDINVLADEYLRLSYHGMKAKDNSFNAILRIDFDKSIGKIDIIPQDIGRVLLNLYNNAFYAVNEKKKQQRENYEPAVSVSTKKAGDKVKIKVADNGNGIPQTVVDKVFQPFFTTKPTGQGTGLGLSLSYDIIKAHGGEIKVETKEGEGSEFIIQLPVK